MKPFGYKANHLHDSQDFIFMQRKHNLLVKSGVIAVLIEGKPIFFLHICLALLFCGYKLMPCADVDEGVQKEV